MVNRRGARPRGFLAALILCLLAAALTVPAAAAEPASASPAGSPAPGAPGAPGASDVDASGAARRIPAAAGCSNQPGPAPVGLRGLEPAQLRAAYGLDGLVAAGADGSGQSVAILLPGESLDPTAWQQFSDCFGPFATPHEQLIGGGAPDPGGEGILDPIAVAIGAPGAQIYLFETSADNQYQPTALPLLLAAALDPANTGGQLVTSITTSVGGCEAGYTDAQRAVLDPLLKRAFDEGVTTFVSSGDGGSGGDSFGATGCPSWPFTPAQPPAEDELGVGYPASSPYVTTVGGTVLRVGAEPERIGSPAAGKVAEEVWNESFPLGASTSADSWFAAGGGRSSVYTIAGDAPWQADVGLSGAEEKPDIAALAGSPFFPGPYFGTSAASPFMAGAFATLDSFLQLRGVPRLTKLNPELYKLAGRPEHYERDFYDITEGGNDPFLPPSQLGCCTAGTGYDMASGLGSVRFAGLAADLAPAAPTPTPTPNPTPSQSPTPTSSPIPAGSPPQVAPPAPAPDAGALAATGPPDLGALLLGGALALLAGAVLLRPRRRTRPSR